MFEGFKCNFVFLLGPSPRLRFGVATFRSALALGPARFAGGSGPAAHCFTSLVHCFGFGFWPSDGRGGGTPAAFGGCNPEQRDPRRGEAPKRKNYPLFLKSSKQIKIIQNLDMNHQDDFAYQYAEAHSKGNAPQGILRKLERRTHLEAQMPQMLSGFVQGQFFGFLSHLIQARQILEIGTFTGYSALCWAQGLAPDGRVHTLDINPETMALARETWQEAGLEHKIQGHLGPALETLKQFEPEQFDLVFIDADKSNYPAYYEACLPLLRPQGLLLVDNVLWSGRVLDKEDNRARAIHQLNTTIQADARVRNVLLPLRDGLLLVQKII